MKRGAAMTDELVGAVADLVAGSVAGMKRSDVRIITSDGRSYRAIDAPAGETQKLGKLAAAEAYYAQRIRRAISHIDGATVVVHVEPAGDDYRCRGAWISVPRSHVESVARRNGRQTVEAAMAAVSSQVRQAAMQALGDGGVEIAVDWHYDGAAPVAAVPDKPARGFGAAEAGLVLAVVIAGCAAGIVVWRRRTGHTSNKAKPPSAKGPGNPLDELLQAPVEDIAALVRDEHPQTIAVVLGQLESDRAGMVLARLPQDVQMAVSRRMRDTAETDGRALREVAAAMGNRWQQTIGVGERTGNSADTGPVARAPKEPSRATEEPRKRMFSFEDLASLGEEELRAGLDRTDSRELAVALRTATKQLTQKVFSCLSAHGSRRLRARMQQIGPVRLSEVEAAQRNVVSEVFQRLGRYTAERKTKQPA
jgi:hypothetical protein